jgi:hypothetical protein
LEKVLSPDEKIRRAEEIYYRKQMQTRGKDVARVNVSEKRNLSFFRKMFLQLLICVFLYTILYLIQTTNYVFSADVINQVRWALSYDIDFPKIYMQIGEYINSLKMNGKSTEQDGQEQMQTDETPEVPQESDTTEDVPEEPIAQDNGEEAAGVRWSRYR